MVDRSFGPETTEAVSRAVGLSAESFADASAMPHILQLTRTLSERSGVTAKSILTSYGESLFPRLAGMYPELVAGVTNPFVVLERIVDVTLHEVRALNPQAPLPQFSFERQGDSGCAVECRAGGPIADFVEGVVRGCMAYCRRPAEVRRTALAGPEGHNVRFEVALVLSRAA